MKHKPAGKVISIAVLLTALGGMYFIAKNLKNFEALVVSAGLFGPVVAVSLYAVFAPTPIATDPITLTSGALFGPFVGTLIGWAGNNLAALVEYAIGRRISESIDYEVYRKKLPLGIGKLPIDSPVLLIFGRMIPFYGSKVISLMAGMYGVSIKRYIWTSAVVNLTGSALLSYGGHRLFTLLKMLVIVD